MKLTLVLIGLTLAAALAILDLCRKDRRHLVRASAAVVVLILIVAAWAAIGEEAENRKAFQDLIRRTAAPWEEYKVRIRVLEGTNTDAQIRLRLQYPEGPTEWVRVNESGEAVDAGDRVYVVRWVGSFSETPRALEIKHGSGKVDAQRLGVGSIEVTDVKRGHVYKLASEDLAPIPKDNKLNIRVCPLTMVDLGK